MQLITFLSAAAATVATASARNAVDLNKSCDKSQPHARIINRCDYPVYIWSVFKGDGCPTDEMVTLKKGESYQENYALASTPGANGKGVAVKISRTNQCKGNDITQLEYYLDDINKDSRFRLNYLDVSYVDCTTDCPTKQEGYYLTAGNAAAKAARASADNSWCPVLACSDSASCAKMSYILPDDVQTKTCDLDSNMDFYMCGSQPPSADDDKPAPASSSKKVDTPSPKPSSTLKVVSSPVYKANIAAVTNAPEIKEPVKTPKIQTKVVYVTAYETVNAKRHEHRHAHARRHQPFNA